MDLVGTLGKMILSGAMKRGGGADILGGLLGGAAQKGQEGAGGLGGLLGGLSGGGNADAGGLGGLLGKATQGGSGGGLGDLLGKLQQGGQVPQQAPQGANAGAGGLGDLLGGLLGGQAGAQGGGLGDLLGAALGGQIPGAAQVPAPSAQQTGQAELLIKAMISAAKSDGAVDAQEQEKIVGQLGDIDAEEAAFIRAEMQKPLDLAGLVNSVPRGMEQQVYVLSLMSIDLDSKAEADYLDKLAQGLNINNQVSNQLHQELGAPLLHA
ncbi:MAG: DUF533 domain-containing protein [Granulosicoccaceae bacterium]